MLLILIPAALSLSRVHPIQRLEEGIELGRRGTVEEVPRRAAATTLIPFMQLYETPRNFLDSNATDLFGADVTNYASLPTKPT